MRLTGRVRRWTAGVAIAGALISVGWWAGRVTVGSSAEDYNPQIKTLTSTVVEATVGRSLSLTATVEQPLLQVAVNSMAGIVTSIDLPNIAKNGSTLYSINAVPVRAVAGSMPFYRDLASGDDGADVAQLQRALHDLGHYDGPANGKFRWTTTQAVKAWQRALRMPESGIVALGEVVAVPKLPGRIRLGEQIAKGSRLAGGEPAIFAPSGKVHFALIVTQNQARLIPAEASVVITHADHVWTARVGKSSTGAENTVRFEIKGPRGGAVCGRDCAALPAQERTSLPAKVTVVPDIVGPAVPAAAVHTEPDGSTYVLLPDGSRRDVTVLGSSGGIIVVGGLNVGDQVLVASDARS